MESGWDPEVKNFFKKILNSISLSLLWMMATATAGLYFELAYANEKPLLYSILFYLLSSSSLIWLLFYIYRLWRK